MISVFESLYVVVDCQVIVIVLLLSCIYQYIAFDKSRYLSQADLLIKEVHNVLGKERERDKRLGKSTDDDPLLGGLRIGKVDPEGKSPTSYYVFILLNVLLLSFKGTRDGDGQYFHYLTKWMVALNRYSIAANSPRHNYLAIQLANVSCSSFFNLKHCVTFNPRTGNSRQVCVSARHSSSTYVLENEH
jgi:hypothetical protein